MVEAAFFLLQLTTIFSVAKIVYKLGHEETDAEIWHSFVNLFNEQPSARHAHLNFEKEFFINN